MRIALVTFGDAGVQEWRKFSFPLKERYCALHGYGFIAARERLDDRPAGWTKIPLLLLKNLPDYDWLYWSDADSLVMQPQLKLERFIAAGADFVFCIAGLHGTINSGEFFVKNTPWAADFLKTVYGQTFLVNDERGRPRTLGDRLKRLFCGCVGCRKFRFDQKGFVHVMTRLSPDELADRFIIYPPGHPLYFNGYGDDYAPGCFVEHFPGSHKDLTLFRAEAEVARGRLETLERTAAV